MGMPLVTDTPAGSSGNRLARPSDNAAVRHLDPPTLETTARGSCPKECLPRVRKHLATCSRCRAAVVGLASGVPVSLGDTVDDAPAHLVKRALKAAPVAVALVLTALMLWLVPPAAPAVSEAPSPPMAEPTP
jgi:hypothetical protein